MDPLSRSASTPGGSSPAGSVASLEALSKEQLVLALKRAKDQMDAEKRRADALQEELRLAKEHNINVQKQVEQEEEYITNRLMKRLEQLKKDKLLLSTEVEQQEKFLADTLQKRLEKLSVEKVELENRLEAEQEYIVNRLQKQLEQLQAEKNKLYKEKIDLENQLEAEQEYILNKLQKQVDKLASEKLNLAKEKSDLQRQINDLGASVERLNRDKVALEQQMEMEEENIVNKLQRQLESLLHNLRTIEQRLEVKGITMKDLGIAPGDLCTDWARAIYSRSPSSSMSLSLGRQHSSTDPLHPYHNSPPAALGGGPLVGSRRERPLSAHSNSLSEVYAK